MANDFQIPRGLPIRPSTPVAPKERRWADTTKPIGKDFSQILNDKLEKSGIKFSAHAEKRLQVRGIDLTSSQLESLETAVDRLAAKGGRESLVLMGDLAFVVSVKNRTVITTIDGESLKENVFTQIDSAVITE